MDRAHGEHAAALEESSRVSNIARYWRLITFSRSLSKISKIEWHGTFVNSELLSPEGLKSELYELK